MGSGVKGFGTNERTHLCPVDYLSAQLDTTVRGWQPCLWALATIPYWPRRLLSSLLVVLSPHRLKDLLSHKSLSTLPLLSFFTSPS